MAGGIRFVMEGPNADLSQKKKRARLITACDACRTKKIKCVQPDVTVECEACRRSQTACLFGDRDRYHSERGISTALPHHHDRSARHGPLSGYRYIPNQQRERAYSIDSWSLSAPVQPVQSPSTSLLRHSAHLFHPSEPQRPRPDLLAHLLTLFISKLWANFAFLDLSRLRRAISDPKSLNPVLANGIAALASRLSTHRDFVDSNVKKQLYGEPYLHMAKLLLTYAGTSASTSTSPLSVASPMERLHAMILVAWAEYGNTAPVSPLMPESGGMSVYGRMAIQLALELGLDKATETTGSVERLTWFYVRKLDLMCSWTINAPSMIPPNTPIHSRELTPLAVEDVSKEDVNGTTTLIFACLNEIFAIHDAISTLMKTSSLDPSQTPEQAITALQNRLDKFVQHLHSVRDLTFTRENYEVFARRGWGSLLVLLHLMYHGTNCISHWPTLFREFDPTTIRTNIEIAYTSALAIVDVLFTSKSVDPQAAVLDPFLEVPLAVATRVLLSAPSALASNGPEVAQDSRLGWSTCMQGLTELSEYWVSTHVVSQPTSSASTASCSTPPAYDIYTTSSSTAPWSIAPPMSSSSSSSPSTSRSSPSVTTPADPAYFDIFTQPPPPSQGGTFEIQLGSTMSSVSSTPSISSASTASTSSSPPQTPSLAFIPETRFDLFSTSGVGVQGDIPPQGLGLGLGGISNMAAGAGIGMSSMAMGIDQTFTFDSIPPPLPTLPNLPNLPGWDMSFLDVEHSKGSGEIDLMLNGGGDGAQLMDFSKTSTTFGSTMSVPVMTGFNAEAFFMTQSNEQAQTLAQAQ